MKYRFHETRFMAGEYNPATSRTPFFGVVPLEETREEVKSEE
jgi:hypothetical protein